MLRSAAPLIENRFFAQLFFPFLTIADVMALSLTCSEFKDLAKSITNEEIIPLKKLLPVLSTGQREATRSNRYHIFGIVTNSAGLITTSALYGLNQALRYINYSKWKSSPLLLNSTMTCEDYTEGTCNLNICPPTCEFTFNMTDTMASFCNDLYKSTDSLCDSNTIELIFLACFIALPFLYCLAIKNIPSLHKEPVASDLDKDNLDILSKSYEGKCTPDELRRIPFSNIQNGLQKYVKSLSVLSRRRESREPYLLLEPIEEKEEKEERKEFSDDKSLNITLLARRLS